MYILIGIFSVNAFCATDPIPDFEAELRALETNQLKIEELQMANADAVTDVITDEVATAQAASLKPEKESSHDKPTSRALEKIDWAVDNSTPEPTAPIKVRRIRSR